MSGFRSRVYVVLRAPHGQGLRTYELDALWDSGAAVSVLPAYMFDERPVRYAALQGFDPKQGTVLTPVADVEWGILLPDGEVEWQTLPTAFVPGAGPILSVQELVRRGMEVVFT